MKLDLPKYASRYVVAFSGGADSALLAFLLKEQGYNFRLVHVVHPDSKASKDDDDIREFCENWAEVYAVPIKCIDIILNQNEVKKLGVEAAERSSRYECLYNEMSHDEILLTGHHLDDSIETLLFRLCRGSSVKGLSGISSCSENSRLIRPLINLSKEKIRQQVAAQSILYRYDSTNDSTDLSRGFIRNKVIPLLKEHFSETKVYASFKRVMQNMSECSELTQDLFDMDYHQCKLGVTGINRNIFLQLNGRRQRNLIYHFIAKRFGKFITRNAIEEIQKRCLSKKKNYQFEVSGITIALQDNCILLSD